MSNKLMILLRYILQLHLLGHVSRAGSTSKEDVGDHG